MTIFGQLIPQEIVWSALISFGFAGIVAIWCVVRAIAVWRDTRAARRAASIGPMRQYLMRNGVFSAALSEVASENPDRARADATRLHTVLSVDALGSLAMDALDEAAHAHTAELRNLAYMPLLIGLFGTVIGLMALLRADHTEMQRHLGGVLVGTLSGVGATLLASLAVAMLGGFTAAGRQTVATMVFQRLLPLVAPQRLAVEIEDRLLSVIDERARALVKDVTDRLDPLGQNLARNAAASTRAAASAAQAFSRTVQAIEGAPLLEQITKQLVQASRNAETASHRLSADAERLAAMQDSAQVNVESLVGASTALSSTAAKLLVSVDAVHRGVLGEAPSLTSAVVNIETEARALTTLVERVAGQVNALSQEIIGLGAEIKQFGAHRVDDLGKQLTQQAGLLVSAVREQLEGAPGRTSDALQRVGLTADTMTTQIRNATSSLEELDTRSRALVAFLNQEVIAASNVNPPQAPAPGVGLTEGDRRMLREVLGVLSSTTVSLRDLVNVMLDERRRKQEPGFVRRAIQGLPLGQWGRGRGKT